MLIQDLQGFPPKSRASKNLVGLSEKISVPETSKVSKTFEVLKNETNVTSRFFLKHEEKQIKKWSRLKKVALINNEFEKLSNLEKRSLRNRSRNNIITLSHRVFYDSPDSYRERKTYRDAWVLDTPNFSAQATKFGTRTDMKYKLMSHLVSRSR